MIGSVFYLIAVTCEPGYLCQAYRFDDLPEFTNRADCQVYRDQAAAQFEITHGLFVCVTDPVENSAGGALDEVELIAGI